MQQDLFSRTPASSGRSSRIKVPVSSAPNGSDSNVVGSTVSRLIPETERIAASLLEIGERLEARDRKMREMLNHAASAGDIALVRRLLACWEDDADLAK